ANIQIHLSGIEQLPKQSGARRSGHLVEQVTGRIGERCAETEDLLEPDPGVDGYCPLARFLRGLAPGKRRQPAKAVVACRRPCFDFRLRTRLGVAWRGSPCLHRRGGCQTQGSDFQEIAARMLPRHIDLALSTDWIFIKPETHLSTYVA